MSETDRKRKLKLYKFLNRETGTEGKQQMQGMTRGSPMVQPMGSQPQSFGIISPPQSFGSKLPPVLQHFPGPPQKQSSSYAGAQKQPAPDMSGVGIFLQVSENDPGVAYVQQIVPRSSAERCGMIELGDELMAAGDVGQKPTPIAGNGLIVLREKIVGRQGSFALLHFRRKATGEIFEVELMRGSPEYIEMINFNTGLKDKQQNDMLRIQELENQVLNLQQQVQGYASQNQINEDPRIGPLEDELRARMDDLRRFEDMLLRAKDRTSEALRARDAAIEQLEMWKRAHALDTRTTTVKVEDSEDYRNLLAEKNYYIQANGNLQSENKELKQERDMLKQQLRDFKVKFFMD